MKLKMDKNTYKSAENYQERRKSNRNTGGTTSAKTMGRCEAKSIQIPQVSNMPSRLMAQDVLVFDLQTKTGH